MLTYRLYVQLLLGIFLLLIWSCNTSNENTRSVFKDPSYIKKVEFVCGEVKMTEYNSPSSILYGIMNRDTVILDTIYSCMDTVSHQRIKEMNRPIEHIVATNYSYYGGHGILHYATLDKNQVQIYRADEDEEAPEDAVIDFVIIGKYQDGKYIKIR